MTAPLPITEDKRLDALQSYDVLDTAPEPAFDDITLLAAQICGVPIAAISLIDERRQWFKSMVGLDVRETSRDVSFCAHTILQPDLMLVPDAEADPRFSDNPLVTGNPHIRFYAGTPLVSPDGHALGSLCVIDRVPRTLTPSQQAALAALGHQIVDLLTLRKTLAERDQAQARLREFAEQLHTTVEAMQEGLVLQDVNGVIQVCNHAAEQILGLTAAQMMGRTSLDPRWRAIREDGDEFPGEQHPAMRALHTGAAQRDVLMGIYKPDDTLAWISVNASPMFRPGEARPYSVVVTFADVTERKQSDDARGRLAAIVDSSTDAIVSATLDGTIVSWNAGAEALYGYAASEMVGNNAATLAGPDQVSPVPDVIRKLRRGEDVPPMEVMRRRKDRSPVDVHLSFSPIRNAGGEMVGLAAIGRDITAQKRAEDAVRRSEARLAEAQRVARIGSWDFNIETAKLSVSDELLHLFGRDPADGKPSVEMLMAYSHPDDLAVQGAISQQAMQDGLPYEFDIRIRQSDGGYRWAHAVGQGGLDEAGQVCRLFGTLMDIHERKVAEQAQARLTAILEATSDFVGTADPDGRVLYHNQAFRDLLGSDETRERVHLSRTHTPASLERIRREGYPAAKRDGVWQGDSTFVRPDGREVPVSQVVIAHRDAQGRVEYLSTVARDMSAQRQEAEAMEKVRAGLVEAQRLAKMGNWEFDAATGLVTWSEELFRIFGCDPALGSPSADMIAAMYHPDDLHQRQAEVTRALTEGVPFEADRRVVTPDGVVKFVHTIGHPLIGAGGEVTGLFGTVADVTERKTMEAALRESRRFAESITEHSTSIIFVFDLETMSNIYSNRNVGEFLGYSVEQVQALGDGLLAAMLHPDDLPAVQSHFAQFADKADGEVVELEYRARHAGGEWRWIWNREVVFQRRPDGTPCQILGTAQDITGRKRGEEAVREAEQQVRDYAIVLEAKMRELEAANEELERLATTDGLTGLTNHRTFQDRLREEFTRATRYGLSLSLLLLDVDHFKRFNDSYGHPAGDSVLRNVSRILRLSGRVTDIAARYGGEEFAVILPQTDAEGALVVAERVRAAIADAPWELRAVTASLGVSTLTLDTPDPETLISCADQALYRSKTLGRDQVTHSQTLTWDAAPF